MNIREELDQHWAEMKLSLSNLIAALRSGRMPYAVRHALFTSVALLISPLVAAFGVATLGAVRGSSAHLNFGEVAAWILIFYFYALFAAILLGFPCFLVLRKLGAIRWWSAMAVGFLVGVAVIAFVAPRGVAVISVDFEGPLVWGCIGALSALVFWIIWRHGDMRSPSVKEATES